MKIWLFQPFLAKKKPILAISARPILANFVYVLYTNMFLTKNVIKQNIAILSQSSVSFTGLFVKGYVTVKTSNTGKKAAKDFQCVYCETKVIEEFKVKDLNDLMSKWDSLPIPRDKKTKDKYIEVVGSFLPIDYERVIPGPNYSKFI